MSSRAETVRRAFPAFAARDLRALQALMTPNVEILVAAPELAGKPAVFRKTRYVGHAGLREWLAEVDADFTDLSLAAREIEEIGPVVLMLGTLAYESGSSGGGMTIAWVCSFADGRVSRIETYWDWDDARRAAERAA
jgi:ketosteroid isomerase-like protein